MKHVRLATWRRNFLDAAQPGEPEGRALSLLEAFAEVFGISFRHVYPEPGGMHGVAFPSRGVLVLDRDFRRAARGAASKVLDQLEAERAATVEA